MATLYKRWIWANAWSELIGLGGTMLIGFLVFSRLSDRNPVVAIGGAVFAVVAGAALEGGLVGYAQARVLHGAIAQVRKQWWVWGTVAGAGTAWLLGMVPSTVFALTSAAPTEPVEGPDGWIAIALAAGLGLVLGPVLSFPQVLVFHRAGVRAWSWIPANAVAWACGMSIIFAGAGVVPPAAGVVSVAGILLVTCFAAGVAVGIIHGAWLVRIIRHAEAGL